MTDSDTLAAVERWFRSRGIPQFMVELRQRFALHAVYLASRSAPGA